MALLQRVSANPDRTGEQLVDQTGQRLVRSGHASQVLEMVDQPPHSAGIGVSPRAAGSKDPQIGEQVLSFDEASLHLLPESSRQGMRSKNAETNGVVGTLNDLQRGQHPAHNLVVAQGVPLGQPAGNTGTHQTLLEVTAQAMGPVKQGTVAPAESMLGAIPAINRFAESKICTEQRQFRSSTMGWPRPKSSLNRWMM
jgi:hypothetical protein